MRDDKLIIKTSMSDGNYSKDGENVTPRVTISSPVVFEGLRKWWDNLRQLVIIGGDLV